MYTNIVVLYNDGDPASKKALVAAVDLIGLGVAPRISIVSKGKQPKFSELSFEEATQMAGVAVVGDDELSETQAKYYEKTRGLVEEDIKDSGVEIPPFVKFNIFALPNYNPLMIGRYLEALKADCLVVGKSGAGSLRATLGHIAAKVVQEAEIPVLMVQ